MAAAAELLPVTTSTGAAENTSLAVARDWIRRGFFPIPLPYQSKRARLKGWPSLRLTETTAASYFSGRPQNVAVILGDAAGSTDVDCDCQEAISTAVEFLPSTGLMFGRDSKPQSHYFYRSNPPAISEKFVDPNDGQTIVELRSRKKDGTVGFLTTVPPSTHQSGEPIRFEPGGDGEPADVESGVLVRAVHKIAAASLLARRWPEAGQGRHECELALAGVLARAGWSETDVEAFVVATYTAVATHDATKLDRVRESVRSSFAKHDDTSPITGIPRLMQLTNEGTVRTALGWLQIETKPPRSLPAATDWRGGLIRRPSINGPGTPSPLLANAITALREAPEWGGALAFNEFSATITTTRELVWGGATGESWTDQHDRLLTEWLQRQGIHVSTAIAGEAAQTVAMERIYHPVRDYLRGLKWDSKPRLDTWLTTYLGVGASTYVKEIGRRFLISAVARILRPGVKVDTVPVLEGVQGIGKSRVGHILFAPWFCDHLPDLSSKDAYLQLAGVWCVELAELDALGRADAARIKSFLSSSVDRYRVPYGRRAVEVPRSTIFLGTINHSAYLRDETGARRFWPVKCGQIDLDGLRRDRDQLWAEAVVRFDEGAAWWVDSTELTKLAEQEQADRYEGDPWDEAVAEWVQSREDVSVPEVLSGCMMKDPVAQTQTDQKRVARSLRSMGWERYRTRSNGSRKWRYRCGPQSDPLVPVIPVAAPVVVPV